MSKQNTRATIDANIKQNGQQLITGQILNSVLNTMVTDYAEQAETTEKLTDLERNVGERAFSPMMDMTTKLKNGFWSYASGDGTIGTQVSLTFNDNSAWRSTKVKVSKGSTILVTGSPTSRFSLLITDMSNIVIAKYQTPLNNLQVEMVTDGYVYVSLSAASSYMLKVTDELYNLDVISIKGIFPSLPNDIKTNDIYFLTNVNHWYRCYDEMLTREVFVPEREFLFAWDSFVYKYAVDTFVSLSREKALKLQMISPSAINLSVGQSYYNSGENVIYSRRSENVVESYHPTMDCFYLVGTDIYIYNGSSLVPLFGQSKVTTYTANRLTKPIRGFIQSGTPNDYYINTSNPLRNIFSLKGYSGNIQITIGSGYLFTIVGAMTATTTKNGQLARNLTTYNGFVAPDLLDFYVEVKREDGNAIGEYEDSGLRITLDGTPLHGFSLEYEGESTDVSSIPTSELLSSKLVDGWLTTAKIYDYYDALVAQSSVPIDVVDFSSRVSGKPADLSSYPFKVYHIHPSYRLGGNISSAPSVVLTSGTHGAETDGMLNLATLFYSIVNNSDNSMYDKLRMCDMYILPCVNPWGIDSHTRGNFRNVNINRNMCVTGVPFEEGVDDYGTLASYNNSGAFSEYESKIIKALCDSVTPDVLIDYHCFPSGFGDGCQMWYDCDFSDVESFGDLLNVATKIFQNFKDSFEADLPSMMPSTFARITPSDIMQTISFYAHEHKGLGMTIECAGVLDWTNKNKGVSKPRSTELVRCNADYAIRSLYYILSKIKPKEGYMNYENNKVSIIDGGVKVK